MTKDQFTALASTVARHGLTTIAGIAAGAGYLSGSNLLLDIAAPIAAIAATAAWSIASHNSRVASAIAAVEPETLATDLSMLVQILGSASNLGMSSGVVAKIAAMVADTAFENAQPLPPAPLEAVNNLAQNLPPPVSPAQVAAVQNALAAGTLGQPATVTEIVNPTIDARSLIGAPA